MCRPIPPLSLLQGSHQHSKNAGKRDPFEQTSQVRENSKKDAFCMKKLRLKGVLSTNRQRLFIECLPKYLHRGCREVVFYELLFDNDIIK